MKSACGGRFGIRDAALLADPRNNDTWTSPQVPLLLTISNLLGWHFLRSVNSMALLDMFATKDISYQDLLGPDYDKNI